MYSQGQEEATIVGFFGGRKGRFLDLGAYDGKTFSNTRALAEAGWGGTCVECAPRAFAALQGLYGQRADVTLVLAAVGVAPRPLQRLHCTSDAVSTLDERNYQTWRAVANFEPIYVSVVTLGDVLAVAPGPYDFVNVDVEGLSVPLFHEILRLLTPALLCVEHDGEHAACLAAAQPRGYQQVYLDGNNLILARR